MVDVVLQSWLVLWWRTHKFSSFMFVLELFDQCVVPSTRKEPVPPSLDPPWSLHGHVCLCLLTQQTFHGSVFHFHVPVPISAFFHGSLNVPIEHHPTIRYMVYNGYYKVMFKYSQNGTVTNPCFLKQLAPNRYWSPPTWSLEFFRPLTQVLRSASEYCDILGQTHVVFKCVYNMNIYGSITL